MKQIKTIFTILTKKSFKIMAEYIVSGKKIKDNIFRLKNAFDKEGLDFQLFYSVKTNFSDKILRCIKENESEFEIVSGFEWDMVKKFKPEHIVLNGPAKSIELIREIVRDVKILYFNVDNDTDLEILKKVSNANLNKMKIGLRAYLPKDGIWNRFGYNVSESDLEDKIKTINSISKLDGIHFHFSTNNFNIENYKFLFFAIKEVLKKYKQDITFLDMGGGLPAANEFIFWKDVYEKLPILVKASFPKVKIISEAGRNIVSDAVDLKANIISIKKIRDGYFDVVIDANIMHFQCISEKKFWIEHIPIKKAVQNPTKINIFGNSCMQIDKITNDFLISQIPFVGDRIIVHNIGAYSYSQAANFISLIPKVKIYE